MTREQAAQWIEAGAHRLRGLRSGQGARHFLLLHGLMDTLEIWDLVAPALETRGRVGRIDLRGHGESGAPEGPCSRRDLARDAVAALDAWGVERSLLVGHSMGGVVALETALAFPARVAGLVLIGTTGQCSERVADWYERIARAGESEGGAGLAREVYGERSRRAVHGDPRAIAEVTRMLESLYTDPLTPRLRDIACPALVIVGERDPMGPKASEILHAALPAGRATLVRVPERGHWLHREAADELIAALDHWLATHAL